MAHTKNFYLLLHSHNNTQVIHYFIKKIVNDIILSFKINQKIYKINMNKYIILF